MFFLVPPLKAPDLGSYAIIYTGCRWFARHQSLAVKLFLSKLGNDLYLSGIDSSKPNTLLGLRRRLSKTT